MGGLWKLAAMSAVIGAGLVVVWQAQQGLQTQADAGMTTAAPVAVVESAETPQTLTPAVPGALTAANLSVPPEADPFFAVNPLAEASAPDTLEAAAPTAATPEALSNSSGFPPEARYTRGLDFRRSEELSNAPQPPAAPIRAQVLAVESQPAAASSAPRKLASTSDDIPLLVPDSDPQPPAKPIANESSSAAIELTAAETAADSPASEPDPFADSAPPELPSALSTPTRATGAAPEPADPEVFDPFGKMTQPAPSAAPTLPAESSDPFEDSAPPPLAGAAPVPESNPPAAAPATSPRSSALPRLPTEVEPFDPFADDPARSPTRAGAPAPLPLDDEPAMNPVRSNPAAEEPEFDPFGSGSAPEPSPTPARTNTPERSAVPTTAGEEPAPEAAPNPQPARDPSLFRGDGEISADVPRGVQEPRLTIEKVAPKSAVLGQPVIYSVIIKNVGGSPATQVTIEDRIPKGSRLVGTAPQAEMIEKRLVWRKIGTLEPGEERKISIKVIPEEEGAIGSVARVTFIAEVAAEIVVQAPKLKVTVNSPSEAKVGDAVPLVFTVSNPGNGDAENVIVRSLIPEGLQHPAGNDLEYTIGTLASKETREVRLEVTAAKPGRVNPEAIVTADGNLAIKSKFALEIVGEQLLLKRSGRDQVYLGRNAVFSNTVTNEGQRPVEDVRLAETVPEGFDFVSATNGGKYNAADRTVNWSLGLLPPAGSTTVSITLAAKEKGRFGATVTASGPVGSATVSPNVTVEGYPALAVERLGDERLVAIGETLTTKVELQNRGSATANHVGLAVTVPKELRFVSASGPSQYRVEGQRLVFDPIDAVEPRGAATYELTFEAQMSGDSRLGMEITADHLRLPVRHDEAVQVLSEAK